MAWMLVPDSLVWVFPKLLVCWNFPAQPSLELQRMAPKKREKISRSLDKSADADGRGPTASSWLEGNSNNNNHSLQHEYTMHWTLSQVGCSIENRTLKVQVTQTFPGLSLLWHLDGRFRFWCKQHESIHPALYQQSKLLLVVKSWEYLVPTEHCLRTIASLSIAAYRVDPVMTTVDSLSGCTSSRTTCHNAQIISN